MARLRRADCSGPGFRRVKRGRGFSYLDEEGDPIDEPDVVERIRGLGIPPAWKEVWICPWDRGHIQATGLDAAGRKQYLYHQDWRTRRDAEKFDEMLDFAKDLPALRKHIASELESGDELTRDRVLACAVRLLDIGFFRIGSEDYAVENESYGLATMLKEHVELRDGGALVFDYPSMSGKRRVQSVVDEDVSAIVKRLKARRGGLPELLAYKEGRRWVDVRSADITEYLKDRTGEDISAKDFRTWNATVVAARALAVSGLAQGTKTGRKRAINRAVKEVAYYLGNTPAVARASYIDPRVFDRFRDGRTIDATLVRTDGADESSLHGAIEADVLDLIADADDSDRLVEVDELHDLVA
jgi:DNA topoisomerase IB